MEGVYIIGNDEHRWYKIGMSVKTEERIRDIASGVPFPVKHIASYPCRRKYTRLLEGYLHSHFQPDRIQREWFALTEDQLACIPDLVSQWKVKHGAKLDTDSSLEEIIISSLVKHSDVPMWEAFDKVMAEFSFSKAQVKAAVKRRGYQHAYVPLPLEAVCPVHPDKALRCPACTSARGGESKSAKKRAAARKNGRKNKGKKS